MVVSPGDIYFGLLQNPQHQKNLPMLGTAYFDLTPVDGNTKQNKLKSAKPERAWSKSSRLMNLGLSSGLSLDLS
jgi:hypothetical protein